MCPRQAVVGLPRAVCHWSEPKGDSGSAQRARIKRATLRGSLFALRAARFLARASAISASSRTGSWGCFIFSPFLTHSAISLVGVGCLLKSIMQMSVAAILSEDSDSIAARSHRCSSPMCVPGWLLRFAAACWPAMSARSLQISCMVPSVWVRKVGDPRCAASRPS